MHIFSNLYHYLAALSRGKVILWCYLIWYLVIASQHFEPNPTLWLNSLGISGVIGFALLLSVSNGVSQPDHWQKMRLFLMPFCVSSFSSLIKDKGFVLIFPPTFAELRAAMGSCAMFVLVVMTAKFVASKQMMHRRLVQSVK